ncbi:MAG TPA: hypothetical protein VFD59_12760 [Nocardioidaceae bacterium]|nr:hypothetical protein [Nocardioidaceae bacterium]
MTSRESKRLLVSSPVATRPRPATPTRGRGGAGAHYQLGGQQALVIALRRAVLAGLQHVDQGRDRGLALG